MDGGADRGEGQAVIPQNTTLSASLFAGMRMQPGLEDHTDKELEAILEDYGCKFWLFNGQPVCTFPPLHEMRAAWCHRHGDKIWPKKKGWTIPDPPRPIHASEVH